MDFCFFRQSDTYLKANLDTGLDTSKLDVEGTCAAIWTVPAASTVRNSRSSIFVRRDPVIILWTQAWHQRVLHFGGLCRDRPGGHRRNPTQNCAICSDDVTGSRGSLPGRFRFLSTPRNAPAAQALHPSRALFLTFFFQLLPGMFERCELVASRQIPRMAKENTFEAFFMSHAVLMFLVCPFSPGSCHLVMLPFALCAAGWSAFKIWVSFYFDGVSLPWSEDLNDLKWQLCSLE